MHSALNDLMFYILLNQCYHSYFDRDDSDQVAQVRSISQTFHRFEDVQHILMNQNIHHYKHHELQNQIESTHSL